MSDWSHKECRDEKDKKKFELTPKLESWDGPVVVGYDYFADLGELIQRFEDDGEDLPEYAGCCVEESWVKLKLDNILDGLEPPDEWDRELNGVKELEEAINKFNELNKNEKIWRPNGKFVKVTKI